jgi:hypothetical protein
MGNYDKEQLWYVPAGTYTVTIVKVDETVSKSGEWGMVNVRFSVNAPEEHAGELFHHRFFVSSTKGNPNAEKGVAAIRRLTQAAIGNHNNDNWADLVDCSLVVTVKLEDQRPKGDGTFWNPSNILTDIKPLNQGKLKSPPMSSAKVNVELEVIDDELPF